MTYFFEKWVEFYRKKTKHTYDPFDDANIPTHVAIIMDGNGRWARKMGLPRAIGHHAGMKNIKKITMAAAHLGIKVLTLYAFSTENWKRPKDEIEFLMKLPQEFLALEIDELIENKVRVRLTGWKEGLPADALAAIEQSIELTKHNTGLTLNLALNYGGRKEILSGVEHIIQDVRSGIIQNHEVDEAMFSRYMLTSDLPDPDLLIRTSGEIRISNFLLWQLAYSELFFTDKLWPDFHETHFIEAIHEYQRRVRRYGSI